MNSKAIKVILQARLSSSRLPGKVLLPVANIPLIELAYRRAANTGLDVVVATSEDQSDDILADFLLSKNIPFVRGSLNDVLGRFSEAVKGLPSDSIIVRLTGDNLVPDGCFINEAIAHFNRKNISYIRSDMTKLPYGVSVEVFTKSVLDEAVQSTKDSFDLEHVTPYIRRKCGDNIFSSEIDFPKARVTIDYFSDYVFLNSIMSKFADPVSVKWDEILLTIKEKPDFSKFVLGCAQLGNSYGITSKGVVSGDMGQDILMTALDLGIADLDTARAYGASESIIGKSLKQERDKFKIVTKLDHLIPKDCDSDILKKWMRESLLQSLCNLKSDFVDTFLFHRTFQINETSLEILKGFQSEGLIQRFGVSVNDVDELFAALTYKEIKHIQLPSNILDHRWRKNDVQEKLMEFAKVGGSIHVRSAFLQGLLFCNDTSIWPEVDGGYDRKGILDNLEKLEQKYSCKRSILSLKYLLDQQWVSGIVIGVESADQLKETAQLFVEAQNLKKIDVNDLKIFDTIPEALLTPSKWKKK